MDNDGVSANRDIRLTFDEAAADYYDARPDYPEQLYADLLDLTGLDDSSELLEIGCGPGKATLPLANMGFRVTALELGSALAEQARRRLSRFPRVTVINTAFEGWRPPSSVTFDLVYAATAWQWIDPAIRYPHAAALLKPGGYLAVWAAGHAFPSGFDPFFTEIQQVYEQIGDRHLPWPPPEPTPDRATADDMEASARFELVQTRHYVWSIRYDADRYIALLNTFSGHIAMDPARREYLHRRIRDQLGQRPDGHLTRHWSATLTVGRRLQAISQ
jgi:SAM-dependent methyltransferase